MRCSRVVSSRALSAMDVFSLLPDHSAGFSGEPPMDMHIAQDVPLTGIDVYSLPPEEGEAVLRRQLAAAYRLGDYFLWAGALFVQLTARRRGGKAAFPDHPVRLDL